MAHNTGHMKIYLRVHFSMENIMCYDFRSVSRCGQDITKLVTTGSAESILAKLEKEDVISLCLYMLAWTNSI